MVERVSAAFAQQAAEHYTLGVQIRALEAARKKIGDWCKAVMAKLNEREHLYVAGGVEYRALRYDTKKTEWDVPALMKLLDKKGLEFTCLKVVPDEAAIERAVVEGKLTLEELAEVAGVRKTWSFRVDEVE